MIKSIKFKIEILKVIVKNAINNEKTKNKELLKDEALKKDF